jgi:ribonuclease D
MKKEFDPHPFIDNPKVIEDSKALKAFFDRSRNEDVIAVDVESAGFYKYYNRVNLIQVATRREAVIIDPQMFNDFSAFQSFADSSTCTWLFHGGDYDASMLNKDFQVFIPRMFDTRKAAEIRGLKELGLRALTEKYLGFTLDKRLQRCDWSKRPLTTAMKEYGLLDAVCLIPIYDTLKQELTELGRLAWVEEECDFILRHAIEGHKESQEDEAEDIYAFRIKGASRLTKRSQAVLREVWNLRETIAQKLDRAPFMVINNYALYDIAKLSPKTIAGLSTIKSVNKDLLTRYGQSIIEAIKQGLKAPLTDLERPFKPKRKEDLLTAWEGELAKALKEIRNEKADKLNIPPSVLASTQSIYDLAKARPNTLGLLMQSEILHKWQVQILADGFVDILNQEPPPQGKGRRKRKRRPIP